MFDSADFTRIWRELDARAAAGLDTTSVRDAELGLELAQFDCPRCGRRHESLRFR